ncbi:MAG TPA: ATP-binding protein [Thermoanaerobaculia bacterium]
MDDRSRLALLAEAGRKLSESLDYETTLATLARLAIPRFADYCLIFELEEGRELSIIASAHVDPEKESLLHRVSERYQVVPDHLQSAVAQVVHTGEPLLVHEVPPAMGQAVSDDPELLAIFDRLGPRSLLVLPLSARGHALGVIFLAMAVESDRRYEEYDLVLGQELAYRAALAIDNARLYTHAEAANRAKDQFLAVLSHELRTPITPVLMTAIRLGQDPSLPETLREEVERIRRNAELQVKLIEDLLDLTRIAHGKVELHFEAVDVHALVRHAVEVYCASQAHRKKIRCSLRDEALERHVWADPVRLQQVLWNLVQNAVKFTPDGGTVEVRTWNPGPGRLAIEVADSGIGIEPDVLPRLFDAYEQGRRALARRFGGLGMGLALCKHLVELHQGTLTASSAGPGKGATFTLEFSVVLPQSAKVEAILDTRPDGPLRRPLRILLVEDHEDTLHVMAELLELSRHEVARAASMASALRLAASRPFDLLVSDLGLPDGSGLDLMRRVRELYGMKGIAVSGFGTAEDIQLSREAGFLEHLVKPVYPSKLKEAIARVRASSDDSSPGELTIDPIDPARGGTGSPLGGVL